MSAQRVEYLTPARQLLRDWLENWWPFRDKAQELAVEYRQAVDQFPLVFADLARRCGAFDSTTVDGDPVQTLANSARRDVWLHIQEAAELTEADLSHLRQRTEDDGG